MAIEAINPATGAKLYEFPEASTVEIEKVLHQTDRAFQEWRQFDFSKRAVSMRSAAEILRRNIDEYSALMACEMGKPIKQGRAEIEKCATACDYFAVHAETFLAAKTIQTEAAKSFVVFEPLGVILAVMPWNFPFWQVFRCAAPTLMAGNAIVLKHASNVPKCALAIENIFREAGFPANLFRNVFLEKNRAAVLLDHPCIMAATLTGSVAAGRSIAERAGKALKKTVLELGGSDPYIVLEDADLKQAVDTCVAARLINGGQSCIAAKRFIVVNSVLEKFEELFVHGMESQKMGNPLDDTVSIGPMARNDLRQELHTQVERSIAQGAKLRLGGEIPHGAGFFYPPTVLTGVTRSMTVFREETFGPVAAIIEAKDEAEAIELANDSVFGLGAAIFTRDTGRGERIAARQLQAGSCFVNAGVTSDSRLPFGGIKDSGYGRELSSFGIREFVNIKTVYIK